MNPLIELNKLGQSVWFDNIQRAMIKNGDLASKIQNDGLAGITSNPTIFEKAITGSNDYNEDISKLIAEGKSATDIYESLAIEDIRNAADLFKSVYEKTNKLDGYVSLEVSPLLANDTEGTIHEAKRLWTALNRPNVMIKIPATPAGIPAIETCIAAGININVTMIFAVENYVQVAEAYIKGLEQRAAAGLPVDHVASVASVFISRIDAAVDKLLINNEELHGKTAISGAKIQYQKFKGLFESDRFNKLKEKGARVQRPLWASTSTKNPAYSDVLYVETLIGPHTVNTLPPATYNAFKDHGIVVSTLETKLDDAKQSLDAVTSAGVNINQVCKQLQDDGVKAFADSFVSLIGSITSKQSALKQTS